MAKYCSKCGRALPEGVEICSICHGTKSSESDAALFTSMTAETEVWKEVPAPGKGAAAKRRYLNKEKMILYIAAVLLTVITAFVVMRTMPSSVVKRAVSEGDYNKAFSVYSEKLLGKNGAVDKELAVMLHEKAQLLCEDFRAGEIDEQQAEDTFRQLYSFGLGIDELDAEYAAFGKLKGTQSKLEEAEALLNFGSYLEACDLFLSIPDGDSEYAEAQLRASESLDMYAAGVQATASELMSEHSYAEAISLLKNGNEQLKKYETFSSGIDAKLENCCDEYESCALEQARSLADVEDYAAAADVIVRCLMDTGREPESLISALGEYSRLASEKSSRECINKAEELYAAGSTAEAFTELETALAHTGDVETVIQALAALEIRFVDDTIKRADEALADDRENIDAAAEIVRQAREIRGLDGFEEYLEKLDSYRPYDLVQVEYTLRDGDIYRISENFDSIDGISYSGGWIWGGEGAYISFALGGAYDVFEGSLAVRRADNTDVEGWFEVFCDGESKYVSPVKDHTEASSSFSVDIRGCDEFRLVFHSDYETSTADNGYCYHGICAPRLLKNMKS